MWALIGRQLRYPQGACGRLTGHAMRLLNAGPNARAIAALELRGDEDVLDLGCGPGHALRLMAALAPHGVVHGVDQSSVMLAQARRRNRHAVLAGRVRLHLGRFEKLPLPSRSIDKILAVNVAYFWRDHIPILGEIHRVLRPGGTMALYVTDAEVMRRWKFARDETHRLFDRGALVELLRCSAFHDAAIGVADVVIFGKIAGLVATVRSSDDSAALVRPVPDTASNH